jgi:hypothetical protein
MEEAEALAEAARSPRSERAAKTKVQCRKPSLAPVPETITEKGHSPVPETITTVPVPETITTSISPGIGARSDRVALLPGSLPPPPSPPSPAVLWAEFSPSRPRQPTTLGTVSPRKPDAVVIEPIDGAYLIGGRHIEIRDQPSRPIVDVLTPAALASALVH